EISDDCASLRAAIAIDPNWAHLTQVVTSTIEFQTGSLPKVVESILDTPAHALARCPDVLQPVEQGFAPRLGQRHYRLQCLFKHPDQGAVLRPTWAHPGVADF